MAEVNFTVQGKTITTNEKNLSSASSQKNSELKTIKQTLSNALASGAISETGSKTEKENINKDKPIPIVNETKDDANSKTMELEA